MGNFLSKLKINISLFKCFSFKRFKSSCCNKIDVEINNNDTQRKTTFLNCCCFTYYNQNSFHNNNVDI